MVESDNDYVVQHLPTDKILLDVNFNHRIDFRPMDCTELARDIQERGLLSPIIVRPLREKAVPGRYAAETHIIEKGYQYVVIAGHRRLMAMRINEAETIPCFVRDEGISDFECKDINAVENLQRKELSLAEEAKAIEHYWMLRWTLDDVAQRVQKSTSWVRVRYQLLDLPRELMPIAAQGLLTPNDVKELSKLSRSDKNLILQHAAIIRDRRQNGQKQNVTSLLKKRDTYSTKKIRSRTEMQDMMDQIQQVLKNPPEPSILVTKQGNCFATQRDRVDLAGGAAHL